MGEGGGGRGRARCGKEVFTLEFKWAFTYSRITSVPWGWYSKRAAGRERWWQRRATNGAEPTPRVAGTRARISRTVRLGGFSSDRPSRGSRSSIERIDPPAPKEGAGREGTGAPPSGAPPSGAPPSGAPRSGAPRSISSSSLGQKTLMAIRLRWVDLGGLRSSCACLFSRAPNWLHRMKAKAAVELGATRMIRGSISTLSRGGATG